MKRAPKIVARALIFGVFLFVAKLLVDGGAFRTVHPGGVFECESLKGTLYDRAEDLEATSDGWLYLSTGRGLVAKALTTGSPESAPEAVTDPRVLHGISLSPSGQSIFAIDHTNPEADEIRIYSRKPGSGSLVLKKSVPMLRNLNDIAAIDDERAFVTDDHGEQSEFGKKIEDYSRIGQASVYYFDGKTGVQLETGIRFANGVLWSPKDRTLYVAAMLERRIRVYSVAENYLSLTEREPITLDFGPDNLSWDEGKVGERILIAGHPNLLALAKMRGNVLAKSPSMVWELSLHPESLRLLYADDGKELASSSVTVHSGRDYFIGTVFDDHILRCREREKGRAP